jgi:hypothetical protein
MAEKRSDVQIVRDQLTREVSNDAAVIAGQVFRQPEPDVARVSNAQIDARYARAFEENDRAYLIAEAQRDPKQFLEATQRLGVVLPPDKPVEQPAPLPKPAQPRIQPPEPPPSVMPQTMPIDTPPEQLIGPSTPPAPTTETPAPPPPTIRY